MYSHKVAYESSNTLDVFWFFVKPWVNSSPLSLLVEITRKETLRLRIIHPWKIHTRLFTFPPALYTPRLFIPPDFSLPDCLTPRIIHPRITHLGGTWACTNQAQTKLGFISQLSKAYEDIYLPTPPSTPERSGWIKQFINPNKSSNYDVCKGSV